MRFDIVLAGVGGQGVLSLGAVIARAAIDDGLQVQQSEVHGMSQRGGAVVAHLRLADHPIQSGLIPAGTASMVLSLEPLESLRYLHYLAPGGSIVTATAPVENIPDYPPLDQVLERLRQLPGAVLVDADGLAREAGALRATNMVMAGAASPSLPMRSETLERAVAAAFAGRGPELAERNVRAYRLGRGEQT